jgi:hypothetical protein
LIEGCPGGSWPDWICWVVSTDGWVVVAAGAVVAGAAVVPEPASVVPSRNPHIAPKSRATTASSAAIAQVVSPCIPAGSTGGGVVERGVGRELLRGAGCPELLAGVFADGLAEVPPDFPGPLGWGSSSKKES